MLFWIVIAILTVAAVMFLLLPLLRRRAPVDADLAGEAAVYRDQLQELERDRTQGLIAASDADYARAEIARRLLSVSGKPAGENPASTSAAGRNRLAQAFIILALPAIGLGLYLVTGSPDLPSQPLAARLENPGSDLDLLVAKAERHLAQAPDDGAGWDILAPIYFKSGRYGDAEMAYRNAIRLVGPSTERLAGLAETLVNTSDGIVTADARTAFEASVKMGGAHPRSSFYLALALEQDGKADAARAAFEDLAKQSPPGAPWLPLVSEHIAKNGGTALAANDSLPGAGPSQAQVDAAQGAVAGMSAEQRQAMIGGMVESLSAKLKQDPNNLDGWMLLVRSQAMMNDMQGANAALKEALKTFAADGEQGRQLIASARELNVPVDGVPASTPGAAAPPLAPVAGNSAPVPAAGPSQAQVDAAKGTAEGMSDEQRQGMIGGMVASLSAKLKQDPNNFDGWMLLVRSHAMMKDTQGAIGALKAGLETFPADSAQGKQLIASARDLNLPVEEALK